jgi:hypothetical protein
MMVERAAEVFDAGLGRAPSQKVVDGRAVAVGGDGQGVALLDDVLRHAVAHQAGADEADVFCGHGGLLCGRVGRGGRVGKPGGVLAAKESGRAPTYGVGGC